MQTTKRPSPIPNIFGTFGYLSLAIQWLWVFVIFIPPLIANPTIKSFITPEKTDQAVAPSFTINADSLLMTIIAVIVTLIVLGITLVVLVKLPLAIARVGQKSVETVTSNFVPIVSHHKPLSPAKKRIITSRIKILVKLLGTLTAFFVLGIAFFVHIDLETQIIITIGGILMAFSLIWFSLQYLSARLFIFP